MQASAAKGWILQVGFTLAGIVAGYLLMHPFAMLAYILGPQSPHTPMDISIWGHQIHLSFGADMLAMGGAFAFMGGSIHLLGKIGGRLSAWSSPGEGAMFIIEFPKHQAKIR